MCVHRYGCDLKVVRLLRERSHGNSVTQICQKMREQHQEKYLERAAQFMTVCKPFKALQPAGTFPPPLPPCPDLPRPQWLMAVYLRDVLDRVNDIKASLTSTFGCILKVDSTKKITRKLAGAAARSAQWATDVGNEYGQVLTCVLTTSEGGGLRDMARGLVRRYRDAGVEPPKVIYVDRDCCSQAVRKMFHGWNDIVVRLDIWHFMRRLARGCRTESHQLYGVFMARLSVCIFEWDPNDHAQLCRAKAAQLQLSTTEARRCLTRDELALHCRRRTRSTSEIIRLISHLIDSLTGDAGRDTLGLELFDTDVMNKIWADEKKHVRCLQDPDPATVSLYTETGSLVKGGVRLKTYRCGRGTVSLESFHRHLVTFIPGKYCVFF